jgi:rhodanese-related sulfurtransferase
LRKFPKTSESLILKFLTENFLLILIAFASGGMLLWPLVNRQAAGSSLDTLNATRLMNDGDTVIVDVRGNGEFGAGHLPAAKNIPLEDLDKRLGEIPAGKKVLVVCETGQRSGKASSLLKKAGRSEVFGLTGGVAAWRQAGLPIVK